MSANNHDLHHELFNVNYGVIVTDRIFGTEYIPNNEVVQNKLD